MRTPVADTTPAEAAEAPAIEADDIGAEGSTIAYSSSTSGGAGTESSARPSLVAPAGATGRRKEAIARVRLVPGSGQWLVNGKSLEEYFPNKLHQQVVKEPFVLTDLLDRFDVVARITGGGITGQAGALRLGLSRALNEIDAEVNRASLKKAGMLTRDARVKERKKAGLKKARKAPQYSKR